MDKLAWLERISMRLRYKILYQTDTSAYPFSRKLLKEQGTQLENPSSYQYRSLTR